MIDSKGKNGFIRPATVCLIVSFSLVVLSIMDRSVGYAQDIPSKNLEVVLTIPKSAQDPFLSYPTAMQLSEDGSIYICDFQLSSIFRFDKSGDFLQEIGRSGQGPGEFTQQSVFSYSDKKLYVVDQANRRIQILDAKGEYIHSFKVIISPMAIVCDNKKIYAVLLNDEIEAVMKKKPQLITIYDEKGQIAGGFGEYLRLSSDLSNFASKCLLRIYDRKLYVLFRYYPILRIYSIDDGNLLQEMQLEKLNYSRLVSQNFAWGNYKRGKKAFAFRYLFNAFDVNEHGVFIALYIDDIKIDHYDHAGTFVRRYSRQHDVEKFYVFDMKVVASENGQNDDLVFFVLYREEVPKLDLLVAEND